MKYELIKICVTVFLVTLGISAFADPKSIEKSVSRVFPGVQIDEIRASEIDGLFEVLIGPRLFYVSKDGRYLLKGNLVDLEKKKDLTESKIAKARLQAIDKVGTDNMIVFPAKNSKHVVSIFTDIDCGYCRKLHSEMDSYLDRGITIQYLFYPRAGNGSESYNKAVSVWCSEDRNKALTRAKLGESLEAKTCNNPVLEHMALGSAFGMRGTPLLVLGDGSILPGYAPADQLAKRLNRSE